MNALNDGGQAFPGIVRANMGAGEYVDYPQDGMTLRDYFAARALAGILSEDASGLHVDYIPPHIAEKCYKLADAMLAERAK